MMSKATAKKLMVPCVIMTVLIGAIILGFGIWLLVWLDTHPYGTSIYPILLSLLFIGVGGIVTLLSAMLGFLAVTKPSSKLISYYMFLMTFIVIAQIILVSYNYKWKVDAVYDIKTSLKVYIDTTFVHNNPKDPWNIFQSEKQCCGVKGEFDKPKIEDKLNKGLLLEVPKDCNFVTNDPKCDYSTKAIWYNGTKGINHDLDNKNYGQQKGHEYKYCIFKNESGKDIFNGEEKYRAPCIEEQKIQKDALKRGYENWENSTVWQAALKNIEHGIWSKKSVPPSCCKEEYKSLDCGLLEAADNITMWEKKINKNGCYKVYYKEVKKDIGAGHVGGIAIFIMELVFFAVICSLLKKIDPPKHH